MPNTVITIKKSATPAAAPSSLANGELALNFADGILYYKRANGTIGTISGTGGGGGASSYGIVNANGTLLLAGIPTDTFSILPGQNITIVGDAINDRVTIGADLSPANNWANTKLTNSTVTLAGALTTTGSVTANGTVYVTPVGGQEGGEIQLQATGANTNWTVDSYQNNFRVFASSGSSVSNINFFHAIGGGSVRMGVNKADPAYTVDVSGDVNISGTYRVNGTPISTGGTTDLTPANNYANTVGTAGNNYTNTVGASSNAYTNSVGTAGNNYASILVANTAVGANNWANTKLANTSGVSFVGDLYFPTGNVGVGTATPRSKLHANGSISSYSSDGTNYGVLSSDRISIGQNNAFRTVIAHSGNESLHFIPYGSLTLALSSVDFTPSVQIPSGKTFGWSSTTAQSNSPDLVFHRDAANTFAQRNGTAGQTYRLYGTYTDASNHERLRISANTTAHYIIGEEAGTGAARPLYIGTNNSTSLTIDASGNVGIGTVSPVAKLSVEGSLRFASDGAGGNWLQFSRSASNQWALDTQGVGTIFSVVGNQITFPQNVIIQRDGLTITPTNTTGTALRVNHSTTTNNSINLNITPTWNGAGNNFTLIGANVTDTASSTLSSLIDLKVGGTSKFVVSKNGNIDVAGTANISSATLLVAGQNVLSTIYTGDAASNAYSTTVGTAGNNYTNTVGASSNAYTNSVGTAGNNYASILAANNAIGANGWANTVGTAGNNYTNTVSAASNNYASILVANTAVGANNWANTKLANTSGVSFAGNLYFPTGSVGIGTASPTGRLDVWGVGSGRSIQTNPNDYGYALSTFNASAGNAEQFNIKHNLGAVDIRSERGQLNIISNTANPIVFYTANTAERMRIDTSGNVGIGTAAPAYKLDVAGAANISLPTLLVAGQNVLSTIYTGDAASNAYSTIVGTAGNNYTNSVGVAGNNYTNAVGTAGNNYTNTVGASSNAYTNSVGAASNNYASILAANNAIGANGWANTVGSSANNYTNSVGTAGNNYTNTVGAAGNNYASILAANNAIGANNWANSINTFSTSTYVRLTAPSQTITGSLAITGNLTLLGNATTIVSNNLIVGDSLIYLAANNYSGTDILDIGFVANYANGTGANVHTGLIRDHVSKQYYLFQGLDIELQANNQAFTPGANGAVNATLNADLVSNSITLNSQNIYSIIASSGAASNAYTNSVGLAGNNYTNAVGAAGNNYTNAVGTAGNNYTNSVGNASNNYASILAANNAIGANGWANTVGTAGNNYTNSVGAASNNYASILAANNAIGANGWANTLSTIDRSIANTAANSANIFGMVFANTKVASVTSNSNARIWANTITDGSSSKNVFIDLATSGVTAATYGNSTIIPIITVDAYGRITSAANTTLTSTGLANTSGISFNGDLFFPTGNVAVGASSATFNSVAYRLYVNGAFAANTKSFVIDHPTKPGLKLQHGSLEGPENGVYVRGKLDGVKVIQLPDYWEGLVDLSTITVQLTAIGHAQNLYVVAIDGLKVHIDTENHTQPYCYYTVHGERKDVNKLIVEY